MISLHRTPHRESLGLMGVPCSPAEAHRGAERQHHMVGDQLQVSSRRCIPMLGGDGLCVSDADP